MHFPLQPVETVQSRLLPGLPWEQTLIKPSGGVLLAFPIEGLSVRSRHGSFGVICWCFVALLCLVSRSGQKATEEVVQWSSEQDTLEHCQRIVAGEGEGQVTPRLPEQRR